MTSSTTFEFTRRPEMSGEYTFQFSPTQGEIVFSHEWSLRCYNVWGKYTGSGTEGDIHLPYSTQLRVKNMWGSQNFGRLYIETKAITPHSITVEYRIKCYHPGEWYSGLTYSGRLTCITPGDTETEVIRTYTKPIFTDENLETEFPLESMIHIQATDGISTGGTRDCTITTDSGEQIVVPLEESPDIPGYYRRFFTITSGGTWPALFRLHMKEFEHATLKCDVNQDGVYSYWEIWAEKKGIEPKEFITTFADGDYTEAASAFDAEATVFVFATGIYFGPAGTRELRVVADSGDEIHVTLNEITFLIFKGFFLVTDGETDDDLNHLHLEPGEGATLYVDINQDGIPVTCRVSRNRIITGEVVTTYEDGNYVTAQDTFNREATVYVDATDLISSGGIRELIVKADSADEIHVDLIESPTNHYRGSFKVTQASTSDELNQIHLDEGERAILSCDVDRDGESASCEIWCEVKTEIDETYATHYRIQVNTQQDMLGTMMWDSQKCPFVDAVAPGERCPDIEYAGSQLDLSGATTYWWRIKFWINYGAEETPWSIEEAYFIGIRKPAPPDLPTVTSLAGQDIRKPRGKAEVLIDDEWIDLQKVTSIQISNNKNPLDNIETTQGTAYLSNIDREFYPDRRISEFFNQLFGRKIRMSLGFKDEDPTRETYGQNVHLPKMLGIVKSVSTDREAKTAEIVALEFMDFYRTKQIKITPVYEDISLFNLYCSLVQHCFPSWLNQTETDDWDYWVDPLGFRRGNVYIGTGQSGGSEFILIQDCAYTPPRLIYNIVPDSEAIYNNDGFRLKRGEDYEIITEQTDKGIISWIHFLRLPYPTDQDSFYAAITESVRVGVVQYEDTTLIEELEKIALVSDCRLYADADGKLICRSNELDPIVAAEISDETNLMNLSTRKDIDSIINHVVVESKPYQLGTRIDLGTWEITFGDRPEAEAGKEFTFSADNFIENFRFDLSWELKCSQWLGDCFGSGFENDLELPFTCKLPLTGAVGCTKRYGDLYIEPIDFDAYHIRVKLYLYCIHPHHYDNAIVFTARLTCHAEGIGQPETYRGEAIDEASYQDRFIGRRKRTFTPEYLEPGEAQARLAAEALLATLRKIRVYYDCTIRGLPQLELMNTITLTEPKADLMGKKLQAIKLVDNLEPANYISEIGLVEKQFVTAIPYYWETAEHDFIINAQDQLTQTFKFIFDSEILSYKFYHSHTIDIFGQYTFFMFQNMHGEGIDEYFDLPYTVRILAQPIAWPSLPPKTIGTLTISLIEETATSIEVQYELTIPDADKYTWPIDYLGTLSCEAQFKAEYPGTDGGQEPPDEPHYPPDEPYVPPDDDPDGGWEYDMDNYRIAWGVNPSISDMNSAFKKLKEGGINLLQTYQWRGDELDYRQTYLDTAKKYGLKVMPFIYPHRSACYAELIPEEHLRDLESQSKHPALWGFQIWEEPAGHKFMDKADITPEKMIARYQQLKNRWPHLQCSVEDAGRSRFHLLFVPDSFDVWIIGMYPHDDPDEIRRRIYSEKVDCLQTTLREGKDVVPLLQAYCKIPQNTPSEIVPLETQWNIWEGLCGKLSGAGYFTAHSKVGSRIGYLDEAIFWDQIVALNSKIGVTPVP